MLARPDLPKLAVILHRMWVDGTDFNWSTAPRNAHKEITRFPRHGGKDVPAGTVAVVRSLDAWRAPEGATALSTLIRQRHLTPSCGGHAPTAERTVGPARIVMESLTPKPGIREQTGRLPLESMTNSTGAS
jgi:hypothetical protein